MSDAAVSDAALSDVSISDVLKRNDVRRSGTATGSPIVFAHGYGCDQSMWRFVAPMFEADHPVVTFDHVGFGGSDRNAWTLERYGSLEAYAEDVLEVIGELDLTDVIFVGHSVSAMIGILAAVRQPDRFSHLVLVGPSACYIDDPATGYVGGFSAEDIADLVATVDGNHLSWSVGMAPVIMGNADRPELAAELVDSFCRVDPQVASAFVRATFLSDNRADLARVSVPTLVLQCSHDVIAPEAVGRYVHEQIAGSEFVRLEANGHCPNLSAPQETGEAIRAYLARHGAG